LIFSTDANLRIAQEPTRTLVFPTDANLRIAQYATRVLVPNKISTSGAPLMAAM
jgi:hypothetical protein